jgi:putative DNA primase/helicase
MDAAYQRVSFSALLAALDARPCGSVYRARCPVHGSKTLALAIRSDEQRGALLYCHAGCRFDQLTEQLRSMGVWPIECTGAIEYEADAAQRTEWAMALWQQAAPGRGVAQRYLRGRGITLRVPEVIRSHQRIRHLPSGGSWPAMIALVQDVNGVPAAVHRTYLNFADTPTKAPVDPCKMTLGPTRGCAVHLAPAGPRLLLGEGIETVLSAMQVTGLPGWASLGATNLRQVVLPEVVRTVTILADADEAGEDAALRTAWRFTREGRSVRIARPSVGTDFNDVLRETDQ